MGYLIAEILVSLVIAFAIGFISAWLIQRARARRKTQSLRGWFAEAHQACERLEAALGETRALVDFGRELRPTGGVPVEFARDSAKAGTPLDGKIVHLERIIKDREGDIGDIADWQGRFEGLGAKYEDTEQRVATLKTELARLRRQYAPGLPTRAATAVPGGATGAHESADDLKRVSGIGPVFERTLNEMGIYRYEQLARLTEQDLERVAARLATFPDRIVHDRWVEQARELAGPT